MILILGIRGFSEQESPVSVVARFIDIRSPIERAARTFGTALLIAANWGTEWFVLLDEPNFPLGLLVTE